MSNDGSDETLVGAAVPTNEFPQPSPTAVVSMAAPQRSSQVALVFLAVAAGSFLIGIALASVTRTHPADTVIAAQDIGPSGGIVRFEGGELRVPQGALSDVVHIVVHRSTVTDRLRVDAVADGPLVFQPGKLFAYRFEPADVAFSVPAKLSFRLPAGARNGTIFARTDARLTLLTGTVEVDRGTATTALRDFRFGGNG